MVLMKGNAEPWRTHMTFPQSQSLNPRDWDSYYGTCSYAQYQLVMPLTVVCKNSVYRGVCKYGK